jgi:hypothetical protein
MRKRRVQIRKMKNLSGLGVLHQLLALGLRGSAGMRREAPGQGLDSGEREGQERRYGGGGFM